MTPEELLDFPLVREIGIKHSHKAAELNYHRNPGFEFCYSFSGVFSWELESGDNLRIRGNQLSLTNPDTLHRGVHDYMNPGHLLYIVYDLNSDNLRSWGGIGREELDSIKHRIKPHSDSVCLASKELIGTASFLNKLFGKLMKIYNTSEAIQNASDRSELDCKLIGTLQQLRFGILQFLYQAVDSFSAKPDERMPVQVGELLDFIDTNLSKNITMEELASFSRLSRTQIFSMFKRYVGQTPIEYARYLQCLKAGELLQSSDEQITTIAHDLGFCNSQYFAQVFKKFIGLTPREYRVLKIRKHRSSVSGQHDLYGTT